MKNVSIVVGRFFPSSPESEKTGSGPDPDDGDETLRSIRVKERATHFRGTTIVWKWPKTSENRPEEIRFRGWFIALRFFPEFGGESGGRSSTYRPAREVIESLEIINDLTAAAINYTAKTWKLESGFLRRLFRVMTFFLCFPFDFITKDLNVD